MAMQISPLPARAILFAAISALVAPALVSGQELNEVQLGPWNALEKQIELAIAKDYVAEAEYIHPKAIIGGDDLPSPVTDARIKKYMQSFWDSQEPVKSYVLIPVTVTVVDDVAIINAYVKVLAIVDGKPAESVYRLHNTWKKSKETGRWQLLATYNGVVEDGQDQRLMKPTDLCCASLMPPQIDRDLRWR